MEISFTKVDIPYAKMYRYNINEHFIPIILESLNLSNNRSYAFSFGRYVDYDTEKHNKIINYFFVNNKIELKRIVVDEDENSYCVTYGISNIDDVKNNLNKDDIMFLCGLLHNLNLKSYLVAIVSILIEEYKLEFEDIKAYVKSDCFRMQVFESKKS